MRSGVQFPPRAPSLWCSSAAQFNNIYKQQQALIAQANHYILWQKKHSNATLVVGIDEGDVFERVTKDYEFTIEPGDCLLLHTDGVKEALNQEEDEFGIERMKENFANSSANGAEAVLTEMLRTLKDFTGEGPQMDDITLVAIEKR